MLTLPETRPESQPLSEHRQLQVDAVLTEEEIQRQLYGDEPAAEERPGPWRGKPSHDAKVSHLPPDLRKLKATLPAAEWARFQFAMSLRHHHGDSTRAHVGRFLLYLRAVVLEAGLGFSNRHLARSFGRDESTIRHHLRGGRKAHWRRVRLIEHYYATWGRGCGIPLQNTSRKVIPSTEVGGSFSLLTGEAGGNPYPKGESGRHGP